MPHDGPELIGEAIGEAERKPGALVAVMTVLVTLAAAATGYMQATALRDHAEAAVRAERLAALAVDVAAGSNEQVQVQLDRYRTVGEEQQQARHSTGRSPPGGSASHRPRRATRGHRADRADSRSVLRADRPVRRPSAARDLLPRARGGRLRRGRAVQPRPRQVVPDALRAGRAVGGLPAARAA